MVMKKTGILLPVSSLPSREGVGGLGREAYRWLDMLEENGVTIWQILPLNPTGYGNSPYQPYSSYAGDEIYISLERLYEKGLLKELPSRVWEHPERVDFEQVRRFKEPYLREACASQENDQAYEAFASQEWVFQYGVFRAFKKANDDRCWNEWPEEQKSWAEGKREVPEAYREEVGFHIFLQYQFYCQWMEVKEYAGQKQIQIMGDVPFYVGVDSVDVWAGKKNFLLDETGSLTFIAGVPPDYFSATGQRWGNPIYDWDYMKRDGYQFWVDRIGYNQKLFDIIRIDHFRAFDTYWKIPASCPTAVEGEWIEAPGYEVLETLKRELPMVHLVAEDLGDLRPEVHVLKEHYQLKGMKILQFTLHTDGKYAVDDFRDTEHMIIYTGTHDNATIREWYSSLSVARRRKIRKWLKRKGYGGGTVTERLIRYTLNSKAGYAVIPAYDILEEGSDARLNTPGTVGSPNWEWRMTGFENMEKELPRYKREIEKRRNH